MLRTAALAPPPGWAAGLDRASQPLFLHYDGTGWTRMPSAALDLSNVGQVSLTGLAVASGSDAWAVRATISPTPQGGKWTR